MVEKGLSIAAMGRTKSKPKASFFVDGPLHSAFDRGAGVPSLKPEKESRSIGA